MGFRRTGDTAVGARLKAMCKSPKKVRVRNMSVFVFSVLRWRAKIGVSGEIKVDIHVHYYFQYAICARVVIQGA